MKLETKLAIVEQNARRGGIVSASIARDEILAAKLAFNAEMKRIEEKFNLDCWNGFSREFSAIEIESMAGFEAHRKSYMEAAV